MRLPGNSAAPWSAWPIYYVNTISLEDVGGSEPVSSSTAAVSGAEVRQQQQPPELRELYSSGKQYT